MTDGRKEGKQEERKEGRKERPFTCNTDVSSGFA
jgi:hypothetical protein